MQDDSTQVIESSVNLAIKISDDLILFSELKNITFFLEDLIAFFLSFLVFSFSKWISQV